MERLGLAEFVASCRAAGLRDVTELVCRGDGCLFVVTVESPIDGAELSALSDVQWWEHLDGGNDAEVYLCKVSLPAFDGEGRPMETLGLSNSDVRIDGDGIEVTLVGEQADIARGVDAYDAAGVSVLLQRIADYDGPSTVLDGLTDRQREILRTAFDMGYFDVPKAASTADVADELGLDASTVAEHVQRAERNLLAAVLATA